MLMGGSCSMLVDLQRRLDAAQADLRAAKSQALAAREAYLAATDAVSDAEEAQKLLQAVAQTIQQQAHAKIAAVVGRCLSAVWDEPYEFEVVFEQKRGRTDAKLVFLRDGHQVNPMRQSGGGVVDVASFALRLASLLLARPPRRRVLIADEPFRNLSVEYRSRMREVLGELSREMGVQFILVTHYSEFRGDVQIELR